MLKISMLSIALVMSLVLAHAEAATLPIFAVEASTFQVPNAPGNAIDGDLGTRWSAQGDGQHITFELELCNTVSGIKVAWYQGDNGRIASFDVQVSDDGSVWADVHSGQSAGNTLALQGVDFPDTPACFVRIVGHGNTVNDWNSITEVVVEGPNGNTVPVDLSALEAICAPLLAQ